MSAPTSELLGEVANYYSAKLREYGATPQGVDWNGKEGETTGAIQDVQHGDEIFVPLVVASLEPNIKNAACDGIVGDCVWF